MAKAEFTLRCEVRWYGHAMIFCGNILAWIIGPFLGEDQIDLMAEKMARFILRHSIKFTMSP